MGDIWFFNMLNSLIAIELVSMRIIDVDVDSRNNMEIKDGKNHE